MKKKPTIRKPIKTPVAVTYNRKKDYISYNKTIYDQPVKPEVVEVIKKALPAKIVRRHIQSQSSCRRLVRRMNTSSL